MFLQVFVAGMLGAIAPGPDFFLVFRNSLSFGFRVGVATAFGIGTGLLFHASFSVLGLGFLVSSFPVLIVWIRCLGAAYLAWLGIGAIRGRGRRTERLGEVASGMLERRPLLGFTDGLVTNLTNVKCILFFLGIFSQFVGPAAELWEQWICGLLVSLAGTSWFIFLAFVLSVGRRSHGFSRIYGRYQGWIEVFLGLVLLYFSVQIFLSLKA